MRATRSAKIKARLELDTEHCRGFSERRRHAFIRANVVQAFASSFNCLTIERHRTCVERIIDLHVQRKTIEQRRRRSFIIDPFIEQDQADPAVDPLGQALPFDGNTATVERCPQPCCQRCRYALGRRNEDHTAIAFRQHAARKHGPPGAQCRGKVEAAKQPIVIDRGGDFPDRHVRTQHRAERRDKTITPLASGRAHNQAAKRSRIDREHACGQRRIIVCGRRERAHAPNMSAMTRSMRAVEPTSSSGSRRNRCRSAIGAARRRCCSLTLFLPVQAGDRTRRADQCEFSTQSVGAEIHTKTRGALTDLVAHDNRRQPCAGRLQ